MRTIDLFIENNEDDIKKIKEICNDYSLNFRFKDIKNGQFYFSIDSDTEGFELLNTLMGGIINPTKYSEICNLADAEDNYYEINLKLLVNVCEEAADSIEHSNSLFFNFLKSNSIEVLEFFRDNFASEITDFQKKCLEVNIAIKKKDFSKLKNSYEIENPDEVDIKYLRNLTGMNQKDFSIYFGIPVRTLQDWENKKSKCAIYLYNLMLKDLINNGLIFPFYLSHKE